MTKKISKILSFPFRILFSRFTLALLALVIQGGLIGLVYFFFNKYLIYFLGGIGFFSLCLIVYIINSNILSEFKTSWIILILTLPGFGAFFFLFCKIEPTIRSLKTRLQFFKDLNQQFLPQNDQLLNEMKKENEPFYQHAKYLYNVGHYPVYEAEDVKYFKNGECLYPDLLEKLQQAEKYIFFEFFIIANDEMWNKILDILKEKAQKGVDVKILYDGTCSFLLLPKDYPETLKQYGIECLVFSPIIPLISTHYNNRDHRKIVVVDGKYAYTGGINMANEYINTIVRFGYWKDNMIRFSGSAVNTFTILFLESWNLMLLKKVVNCEPYLTHSTTESKDGFIIPFGDDPFHQEPIGKRTYIYLLNTAKEKVDIAMPYFVVDEEFLNALFYASKRGVKIRLILPGIPDKKYVNYVAKTYYKDLLRNEIEIYEYTKGFTHLKVMVKDEEEAVVGTINLDYRSLYLHFEDAVLMYKVKEMKEIIADFEQIFKESKKISQQDLKEYSKMKLFLGQILRIFGPLI